MVQKFLYIFINNKQHDDYRQYFQKNVPSPNNSFTSMVVVVLMVIFSPTKACPNPPSELDDAVMIGIIINIIIIIIIIISSSSSIHDSYVFGWVWNVCGTRLRLTNIFSHSLFLSFSPDLLLLSIESLRYSMSLLVEIM